MSEALPEKIRNINEGSPTPAEALQAISRAKAREVGQMWKEYPGKNMKGIATFRTRNGRTAQIGAIRVNEDPSGLDSVEVWVGEQQGPPTFRLINPPVLIPDPQGSEVLTEFDPLRQKNTVRRFRVDPLQAIAEVIASNNGRES